MSAQKKKLVSMFRYNIADHEAMANTYPNVLAMLGETVEVHHFAYKCPKRHWVHDDPRIHLHEFPMKVRRNSSFDKWLKTVLFYFWGMVAGFWARRNKVDLIYIEEHFQLHPMLVRICAGCPVAISSADILWDVYLPERGALPGLLRKLFDTFDTYTWKRIAGTVTHTRAYKDYAIAKGIDGDTIAVVPEACESHIFFPTDREKARERFGFGPEDFVVVHHGIVQTNKALDRIFGFIEPLMKEHPNIKLSIAGEGPAKAKLEYLAKEKRIAERVQFLGWLPGIDDINLLLNAGDVSLVMREGRFSDHFQVTANLLHSLACGCPTLAANMKGMAELVTDGENGFLFDPFDGDEFRDKLLRMKNDPALRRRMGDAAYETATTRLDPEKVTKEWHDALLSFIPK